MKLSEGEISTQLSLYPSWKRGHDNNIYRNFEFLDFKSCFEFMKKIADLAEEINHHPEWSNVYNRLSISLKTHDADPENGGALSNLDFEMARKIDLIFERV